MIKSHGGERQGEVGTEEMNASEPLIKCRNYRLVYDVKTRNWTYSWDNCSGIVFTGYGASGMEVA